MSSWLLTLLFAAAAGGLLYLLKVPGGMMIGAIFAAGVFGVLTARAQVPPGTQFAAKVIAGAFIASAMQKKNLGYLPALLKPLLVLSAVLLLINLGTGYLIWKVTPLDAASAMMSAIPGGMSDVPLIASEMGANLAAVSALQFVRLVAGIAVLPSIIQRFAEKHWNEQKAKKPLYPRRRETKPARVLLTLLAGTAGGLFGRLIPMPASSLVFSMLAVLLMKILTGIGELPIWLRRAAQLLSGAYIGSGITHGDLLVLKELAFPAFLILLIYTLNCFITGRLLHRLFHFEKKMAMLAATPAGASDMALIAADIGVESPELVILQILRMMTVITVFPSIISAVLTLI